MSISGFTHILSTPKHEPFNPLRPPNPSNRCNVNFRVDFRVCAKIKDFDVKLTDSGSSTRGGYGQFSANPNPSKEDEERQNYHLNTGYAIRSLHEEFPALFYRDLSFDVFRDDIVFKDPLNEFVGIENYKSIFWALRFHGKIFFRALWIEIMSVCQPMEGTIMVRWTIHGVPRVPWESRGRFDGTSEYKLDKNGKIYEHKVHNIAMNSPPKFHVMSVEELIQSLSCPSTPRPTCFETLSSESVSLMEKYAMFRHNSGSAGDCQPEASQDN